MGMILFSTMCCQIVAITL